MHKNSKSVKDREKNKWIGIRVGQDLLNVIKGGNYHISAMWWEKKDCLEEKTMQGTEPRARKQGRPKMRWIDNMEKWAGMSFEKLLRETEDRRR